MAKKKQMRFVTRICCVTFIVGVKTTARRRYKAEAMAFWLHLVPKLHRRGYFELVFHAPQDNSTDSLNMPANATITQASIETSSTTKPVFGSFEDGSVWMSSGADELETSDDGLLMNSTPVSATGVGSRLLLATLAVGGTLLAINCLVFIGMLSHRARRFKQLTTAKQIKPITYVNSQCSLSPVVVFQGRRHGFALVEVQNDGRRYSLKNFLSLAYKIQFSLTEPSISCLTGP